MEEFNHANKLTTSLGHLLLPSKNSRRGPLNLTNVQWKLYEPSLLGAARNACNKSNLSSFIIVLVLADDHIW